jgi:ribosomal-protein-serine acetyltransferase
MKSVLFEKQINDDLSLVIPSLSSASEIFNLIDADREHLRTWLPWVDLTVTIEDTRKNLFERIEKFQKKEQASFYGTLNGDFIASVGFISLKDGEGEIGYWLLSQYGGKGLMTTFVRACVDYGFKELNLNKIVIKCAEGNSKSANIAKRIGFIKSEKAEETCIIHGAEYAMLVFTLNREDYRN